MSATANIGLDAPSSPNQHYMGERIAAHVADIDSVIARINKQSESAEVRGYTG
jgi:hypothetical protein